MDRRTVRMGFTLVELLVVMAIVALLTGILVPAVLKGRQKASVNKAKAEMAGLASTGGMIYLDTGYYVRLGDYDKTDSDITNVRRYSTNDFVANGGQITTTEWDGPYTTYQSGTTYTGAGTTDDEYNAPLDPWNNFYWLGYNSIRAIMVIYSAGPDGNFSTNIDTAIEPDLPVGTSTSATTPDDIEYRFK